MIVFLSDPLTPSSSPLFLQIPAPLPTGPTVLPWETATLALLHRILALSADLRSLVAPASAPAAATASPPGDGTTVVAALSALAADCEAFYSNVVGILPPAAATPTQSETGAASTQPVAPALGFLMNPGKALQRVAPALLLLAPALTGLAGAWSPRVVKYVAAAKKKAKAGQGQAAGALSPMVWR